MGEGKKIIDGGRLWLSIRVALSLFSYGPMMTRSFGLSMLLLCCCMAAAFAKDNPPDVAAAPGSGLACFVVPQGAKDNENPGPSCDEVCAAQNAVCVSVETPFTPASCSLSKNVDTKCRCCRAAR